MSESLLVVNDLTKVFTTRGPAGSRRDIRAVDGVSLTVDHGRTFGIVGESGSGKSTLGRTILQFQRPTSGTVEFDGVRLERLPARRLRPLRRRMQMVFQDPRSSLDGRMTVSDIVGEPVRLRGRTTGTALRERVDELLDMVGIDPAAGARHPHEFSGGQQQRIGIARALACDPSLVVCDEAVSALDVSIQAQVLNLLKDLQSRLGLTYLFISHNLSVVRYLADELAVMYLGRVVETGPTEGLFTAPHHPYTTALLSAVPVPDPVTERRRQRIILSGDAGTGSPTGCRFRARCWLYEQLGRPEACHQEPLLTAVGSRHQAACHFSDQAARPAAR